MAISADELRVAYDARPYADDYTLEAMSFSEWVREVSGNDQHANHNEACLLESSLSHICPHCNSHDPFCNYCEGFGHVTPSMLAEWRQQN